jgi:hypothetical protein
MTYDKIVCVIGYSNVIQRFANETSIFDTFTDLHFYGISNPRVVESTSTAGKLNLDNPKIFILKNFDDLINVYQGDIYDSKTVSKFIRNNAYPILNNFSPTNYLNAVNNKNSFAVMVCPKSFSVINVHSLLLEYSNNAKNLREKLYFMHGNFPDQQAISIAADFETEENELPAIFIQEYDKIENSENKFIKRFKLTTIDPYSLEQISIFFNRYNNASLKRFLRSEKLPQIDKFYLDNVYTIVRKNFDDVVLNNNQNKFSLVYFIRRNCEHCEEVFYSH